MDRGWKARERFFCSIVVDDDEDESIPIDSREEKTLRQG